MNALWKYLLVPLVLLLVPAPLALAADAHGGSPDLFAKPNAGLITAMTTLIVFAALLAVLGKFAWGPIVAGLKAREDRIRKDIADAEASRLRAEATLREYSAKLAAAEAQVREMLAAANAQGERLAADIQSKAQAAAEDTRNRATKEIDAAKNQAIGEIYQKAADIASDMAGKILRRSISADDHRDLVNRGLDKLPSAS